MIWFWQVRLILMNVNVRLITNIHIYEYECIFSDSHSWVWILIFRQKFFHMLHKSSLLFHIHECEYVLSDSHDECKSNLQNKIFFNIMCESSFSFCTHEYEFESTHSHLIHDKSSAVAVIILKLIAFAQIELTVKIISFKSNFWFLHFLSRRSQDDDEYNANQSDYLVNFRYKIEIWHWKIRIAI